MPLSALVTRTEYVGHGSGYIPDDNKVIRPPSSSIRETQLIVNYPVIDLSKGVATAPCCINTNDSFADNSHYYNNEKRNHYTATSLPRSQLHLQTPYSGSPTCMYSIGCPAPYVHSGSSSQTLGHLAHLKEDIYITPWTQAPPKEPHAC